MYQIDPAVTRKAGGKPDFTDWQYDTVVQLVYDICFRRKIKRSMVVGHGKINPIDRADPQGFDWTVSAIASSSFRSEWEELWAMNTFCSDASRAHVPRGFARAVGAAAAGSSGQKWRG